MDPSCDLYLELKDNVNKKCRQHLNDKVRALHYSRDFPIAKERVSTASQFLPQKCCLAVDSRTTRSWEQRVTCGHYSPNGNVFISAYQDLLYLYNTEGTQFKCFKTVPARYVGIGGILSTAFSPDQNWFLYSTCGVHLCNVYGEEEHHYSLNLRPESDDLFLTFSATFSGDSKEILASTSDGKLCVYDRERQKRTLMIDAHQAVIFQDEFDLIDEYPVTFEDECGLIDGYQPVIFADECAQVIYSAGDDGLCKVWDRRCLREIDPNPVGVFTGHKDGITFIDSRGDGRYLITNSKDHSIKLWDIRHFSSDEMIRGACTWVIPYIYSGGAFRDYAEAQLNKFKGDVSVMTYTGHVVHYTLIRCRFSPLATTGQRYIYTGCANGFVMIYDVLTGEIVRSLKSVDSHYLHYPVGDVSWHPTQVATLAASIWIGGTIELWTYDRL